MTKTLLRTAIAVGAVAPLMLIGSGAASAANELTVNAIPIPLVGITLVQVSGAAPDSVCFASQEALDASDITASITSILSNFPVSALSLLPNGTEADASGSAMIVLATSGVTPPYEAHALCMKPALLPIPSLNIRTGKDTVNSGFFGS